MPRRPVASSPVVYLGTWLGWRNRDMEKPFWSRREGPLASCGGGRVDQLAEQPLHPPVDLVPDWANVLQRLAGGVVEFPVEVALAEVHGAGVAAAHGDDDVGGLDDVVGEGLGELLGQ